MLEAQPSVPRPTADEAGPPAGLARISNRTAPAGKHAARDRGTELRPPVGSGATLSTLTPVHAAAQIDRNRNRAVPTLQ